jgi:UDP-N-acetylmuramoyl-tripeptide--D-alanyl-D-alanine ligase
VSIDSRTLTPGDLFVALRGPRHDGHDFVGQALERGAVGALVAEGRWREDTRLRDLARRGGVWLLARDPLEALQRWAREHRRELRPTTVALTGSTGKTTTKALLAAALEAAGKVHAARASHNNEIGVPLTLLGLRGHHTHLVCELGMNQPGEIRRLVAWVAPRVALITGVGLAHVGRLGGPEAILAAKLEITEGLDPEGTLVLPEEPERLQEAARERWPGRVLLFGRGPGCAVRLEGEPEWDWEGTRIRISGLAAPVRLRLLGPGAVWGALAALAVCRALEVDLEAAAARLSAVAPLPGRLRPVEHDGIRFLLDTYNASPEASEANIRFLMRLEARRRLLVFGEMAELGPESRPCHERVGRLAAALDGAFFYGPEARWAHEAALAQGGRSRHFTDREEMIEALAGELGPGDLVLLKGSRRTEMERVYEGLIPRLGRVRDAGRTPEGR